jgi:hypothetical protein
LNAFIKVLAACLFVVVIGLFITGFERIVWMFSGSGLVAVIPQRVYQQIAEIQCNKRSIEVKRDGDGTLRYRCGSYWLLSNSYRSTELTNAWPEIKRQQKNGVFTP